jgi:hypothetical protein
MEQSYNAENDVKLVFPKIPKFSKSIIEGKKLELKKDGNTFTKLEFLDGSVYSIDDSLLTLPNGEKFEGVLSNDNSRLKKGKYFWPNNQKYHGSFDEQNRFFTIEDELSELTFSNGDIFRGKFIDGKITEGTYITEGKEITANFEGGKINGLIEYKDTKKEVTFNGNLKNGKKDDICKTEVKIKDKKYSIKGEYLNGLKDGTTIIREVSPNKDNLYIKGKYKEGERNGYFSIVDKENGINTNHQYISFIQTRLIKEYNKKYNENINGKEVSISITCRNNPINQLKDLISIRFTNLLTLDLTRANIDSIAFLNGDESTLFSLQNLILSYNNISDIRPLVDVDYKKLKTLLLNDNKIEDISCVEQFNFKELEELNLSSNPIKSIQGIEKWEFPNLFNLSFCRTNISDIKPLYKADFPNLIQLDLYLTKIKIIKEDKKDKKVNKDKKDKKEEKKEKKDTLDPTNFEKCKNLKNIIFDSHF